MSLREVAGKGDRLKTLEALRDELASWLDETESGRDRASLSLRFTGVLAQIDEIKTATAEPEQTPTKSPLDELRERREQQRAGGS